MVFTRQGTAEIILFWNINWLQFIFTAPQITHNKFDVTVQSKKGEKQKKQAENKLVVVHEASCARGSRGILLATVEALLTNPKAVP